MERQLKRFLLHTAILISLSLFLMSAKPSLKSGVLTYCSQVVYRFGGKDAYFFIEDISCGLKLVRGVEVGWTFNIGVIKHRNNREQNRLNWMNGSPPLVGSLLRVHCVGARGMQNANADSAVRVNWNKQWVWVWGECLLLGCHMGVTNFISGGLLGKSDGNFNWALKKPPYQYIC